MEVHIYGVLHSLQEVTSLLQSPHAENLLIERKHMRRCTVRAEKEDWKLTQSAEVSHKSETPSIFPRTAAPFHTNKRGSTSFGGGIICTFSMLGTSGVAIAWSLSRYCSESPLLSEQKTYLLSRAWAIPGISAVPPTTRTAWRYLRILSSPPAALALLKIATSKGSLLDSNTTSIGKLPKYDVWFWTGTGWDTVADTDGLRCSGVCCLAVAVSDSGGCDGPSLADATRGVWLSDTIAFSSIISTSMSIVSAWDSDFFDASSEVVGSSTFSLPSPSVSILSVFSSLSLASWVTWTNKYQKTEEESA